MKNLISILLTVIFWTNVFGQHPTAAVDSVKQIRKEITNITRFFDDIHGNDSIPCDYDSIVYSLYIPDRLVVIEKGQASPFHVMTIGSINTKFLNKIKTPENAASAHGIPPDSMFVLDHNQVEQFISDKRDSLKIDTLFILTQSLFDFNTTHFDLISKCSYKENKKNGFEYSYYTIQELKDVCITDNFMLKTKGCWKKGKKIDVWTDYDKTGKIIAVKKYKKGVLIKEKNYN